MPCAAPLPCGILEEDRSWRRSPQSFAVLQGGGAQGRHERYGEQQQQQRCGGAGAVPRGGDSAWGLEQRPRGPEKPRVGKGLCSGSLAEGRRIFPCGLRGWMVGRESLEFDFFPRGGSRVWVGFRVKARTSSAGRVVPLSLSEKPKHRSEERRVEKECRSRWSPYH